MRWRWSINRIALGGDRRVGHHRGRSGCCLRRVGLGRGDLLVRTVLGRRADIDALDSPVGDAFRPTLAVPVTSLVTPGWVDVPTRIRAGPDLWRAVTIFLPRCGHHILPTRVLGLRRDL